jgi:hypothetical protein
MIYMKGLIRSGVITVASYWRLWALYALGAFILWLGFSTISDIHEAYDLACVVTSPYSSTCRGIPTEALVPITVIAAICLPYVLSRWWLS